MPGQSGGDAARMTRNKEARDKLARRLAGEKRQADSLNAERKSQRIDADNRLANERMGGEKYKYYFNRKGSSSGVGWDFVARNRKEKAFDVALKNAGRPDSNSTGMKYARIDPKTKVQVNPY